MNPQLSPGDAYSLISANVQRVVQGKPDVVRMAVVAVFAEGHVLLEDVPGLGKTTLARCLAASVEGTLNRIQFTPDLLPGDITGASIYHQSSERLEFHPGAIFANIVLADEINRGTPKTQSALLEVMAESAVTVDGQRYPVPRPFLVLATQNPIELEGTYRLPEAQLDRFLVRLTVGYPAHDAEVQVVLGDMAGASPAQLGAVLSQEALAGVIASVRQIQAHPAVCSYAVSLAEATRQHPMVRFGASPRGSVALVRAARAWAATDGRGYTTPDDVKAVAPAVLEHRLVLTPEAELNGRKAADVLGEVLRAVPAPGGSATVRG
ncbi:AAA family ATPase [Amycolatopsis sp. lyj-23]|uniref:AAA family ATPase n=1 Tax=Amycolatopsis sp. lyj-23 TaxID=2789283 RepID=UPI00397A8D9F